MFCRHRERHHDNCFQTRPDVPWWGRRWGDMEARMDVGQAPWRTVPGRWLRLQRLSSFLPTMLLWSFQRISGQLCSFFPHYHVHLFPVIAVPNEPQIQYLKTTQIYCLPVLEVSLTGLKASFWQGEYLLEALKHLFPWLFQFLGEFTFLDLWSLPPSAKPVTLISASFHIISLLSLWLTVPGSLTQGPCDYIVPSPPLPQ